MAGFLMISQGLDGVFISIFSVDFKANGHPVSKFEVTIERLCGIGDK